MPHCPWPTSVLTFHVGYVAVILSTGDSHETRTRGHMCDELLKSLHPYTESPAEQQHEVDAARNSGDGEEREAFHGGVQGQRPGQ